VLRGVSFTVPAGGSVALVGLNGAGKSTVVKLLCRFYDPTEGAIRWDGVDLRDLAVDDLRSRIGTLFQDFMSYDLTAAENIGLGDLTAGRDRIAAAGALSGADATVRDLPAGYDTLLSRTFFDQADLADPRTGVALSGGQWQRVALARAYLRADRDLFVLDEPGAGLDPEAEYEVHRRHRAGRATLLISHRLNTVRHADHIVVLEDGRVAEEGSHHELVRAGGRYARLFRLQAEGYREEDRMVMEQA
jgi:ATP-binding cassette subfamily B protein